MIQLETGLTLIALALAMNGFAITVTLSHLVKELKSAADWLEVLASVAEDPDLVEERADRRALQRGEITANEARNRSEHRRQRRATMRGR